MARPTAFSSGFGAGFRGGTGRAQIIIQPGPHATYQDGDILCAFNRRRIRCVHAENICHVKHQGFNGDGLRDLDTLPEVFQKEVYTIKTERIGPLQFRKTRLSDSASFEFTSGFIHTDFDGKDKMFHVEYLSNRKKHPRHRIFGTEGAEVWYGGRTNAAWAKLDTIWDEIEARTALVEQDHALWPASPRELARFLILSVNDMDDATAADLAAPLLDETDPDNPITVSKRKTWIDWRNLRDTVEADVLDFGLQVDIRGRKEVHQEIKNVRTI